MRACAGETVQAGWGLPGPFPHLLPPCVSLRDHRPGQARAGAAWQEGRSDLRRAGLQASDTPNPLQPPTFKLTPNPNGPETAMSAGGPPRQGSKGVLLHTASALSPGLRTCPWSGTPFSCPACQMPHLKPPAHPLNPLCMATTQPVTPETPGTRLWLPGPAGAQLGHMG